MVKKRFLSVLALLLVAGLAYGVPAAEKAKLRALNNGTITVDRAPYNRVNPKGMVTLQSENFESGTRGSWTHTNGLLFPAAWDARPSTYDDPSEILPNSGNYQLWINAYDLASPVTMDTAMSPVVDCSGWGSIRAVWAQRKIYSADSMKVLHRTCTSGVWTDWAVDRVVIPSSSLWDSITVAGPIDSFQLAVYFRSDYGWAGTIDNITILGANIPTAPSGLTSSGISSSQITLNWTDNSTVENLSRIERSTENVDSTFVSVGTVGENVTTYTDGGLTALTQYFYRVRAENSAGNSAYTAVDSATTTNTPAAPLAVIATAADTNVINLTWTDNSANEDSFLIERSDDSTTFAQIAAVDSNVVAYTDSTLTIGTKYFYRVIAKNGNGNSLASNIAKATTYGPPSAAPTALITEAQGATMIDLRWTDNSNNETGFRVERTTDTTAAWDTLVVVGPDTAEYSDTTVLADTTYFYRVRSENTYGNSAYSNISSPPIAPSGLAAAVAGYHSVDLTWTDNSSNEVGFGILRSTNGVNYTLVATVDSNTVAYTDTLLPTTTYYYQVAAMDADSNTAVSDSASVVMPLKDITGLSAPYPGVVSDQYGTTGGEGIAMLTDNNVNTKYLATHTTTWVQWQSTDSVSIVSEYAITSANDAQQRDPMDWTFQGSMDGVTWDTLDTRTGETFSARFQRRTFLFNNSSKYAFYRMDITANLGTIITQIAEWQIYGVAAVDSNPPVTPTNLAATLISTSQINLAWTDNSVNEDSVLVQRSTDPDTSTLVTVMALAANTVAYSDTGLTNNTRYYYRVAAINSYGVSYSNVVNDSTYTPPVDITEYTGNLTCRLNIDGSEGAMKLIDNSTATKFLTYFTTTWVQWQADSAAELRSYTITSANDQPTRDPLNWYFFGSNDGVTWDTLDTQTGQTFASRLLKKTYTISNYTPYTYLKLDITAINGGTQSTQFSEIEIMGYTTGVKNIVAPANLAATAISASKINLRWKDNSKYETSLRLERSLDTLTWDSLAILAANAYSYTDSLLPSVTTYYYRVRAADSLVYGNSAWSNVATATTLDTLATAGLTSFATDTMQISDMWSTVGAEGIQKLVDGNLTTTKYLTVHPNTWVQYALTGGSTAKLKAYVITAANDAAARDLRDWVLLGSNDSTLTVWDTLDTRVGQFSATRLTDLTYLVADTTTEYACFRLDCSTNQSNLRIQVEELRLLGTVTVGVAGPATSVTSIPTQTVLMQNYPNPFGKTRSTTIKFGMARGGFVNVTAYNILGQQVRTLVSKELAAGWHTFNWDGKDKNGNMVAAGVYYCRMTTPGYNKINKMVVTK